ncbi:MAG: hypothetical protein KC486_14625, partial [Myxococcales bacterium]|nr:hypothetical protein [Myxococcales bacterium]
AMEEQARAKAALAAELARDEAAEPDAEPSAAGSRYRPRLLDEAPAKASIDPGEYLCKISREYKLRPCTVRVDDRGHTILTVPEALLAIEGVLYDEGDVVHFDGWTTEERPFGCYICAPRCAIDPSSCDCTEIQPAASVHCLAQPVTFDLKRGGKGWKGTLRYALYSNRYEGSPPDRRPTGYNFEVEEFVVELRPTAGG